MVARCTEYSAKCIGALFWYKPISLAEHCLWLCGLRDLPPDMDLWVSNFFGPIVKDEMIVRPEA